MTSWILLVKIEPCINSVLCVYACNYNICVYNIHTQNTIYVCMYYKAEHTDRFQTKSQTIMNSSGLDLYGSLWLNL